MLTTLYDGLRDVGYCNQRGEIAGHASDRALLARYPLVVEGPAPPNARAILYRSATAALYWSPRSKDGLALYLTPIGLLIERYGLTAAAPWLPLCEALLRKREGWIQLDSDAGHVELGAGVILDATLARRLTREEVGIGLHAARAGGARLLPLDSPLFALASPSAVAEHLRELPEQGWSDPATRLAFEPLPLTPPAPIGNARLEELAPPPLLRFSPRIQPLWDHLLSRRFGFDLLREGGPIMGDAMISLGTATLIGRWMRMDTKDPKWTALCRAAKLDPAQVLPWNFYLARYVHAFAEDQPAYAAAEEEHDTPEIMKVLALGARELNIISHYRGVFVY